MKELKIQDCLKKFNAEIYAQMTKENQQELFEYFKLPNHLLLESWLNGEKPLTGLRLIKMAFYLYERNFLKICLDYGEEAILQIITILAKDIASPGNAAGQIGYKKESDLYRVLLGKSNYSKNSLSAMKLFADLHEKTLNNTTPIKPEIKIIPTPVSCPNQEQMRADLIHTIGSICTCLKPLLKELIESSPDERQKFRNSLGKDERGVFQISNSFFLVSELINALCSEKSIENYKHKNRRNKNA